MPMKPNKGESQDKFMARCVPEMIGTGDNKRPQDQAVAACMTMWRDANKKAVDPEDLADDAPDPDDDESRQDFIDRCTDELSGGDDGVDGDTAEAACEIAWENRAAELKRKSKLHVFRKTHAAEVHGMEFILSDESIDRMGDTISSSGWQLDAFNKNPIALFQHRPDFVIGRWKNIKAKDGELRGHLELAPEGTSARIDEIRKLVEAGILRAVSVGFRALESHPRKSEAGHYVGEQFTKQELVETSLVSVPANANALAVVKTLKISDDVKRLVFAEPGRTDKSNSRQRPTGESAETSRRREKNVMSISERIQDAQAKLVDRREKLAAHLETINDDNVSDEQMEKTNLFNEEIAQLEKHHNMLQTAEKHLGTQAAGGGDNGSGDTGARQVARRPNGNGNMSRQSFYTIPAKKEDRLDLLARAGAIAILAHMSKRSLEATYELVAQTFPHYRNEGIEKLLPVVTRAATAPAMTTVTGWAAELVTQIQSDIMETLMPKSVYPRLAALGLSLQFGRAGRIAIPTRARTPTIAGSFVGEGQPIPVRQGLFTAQILTPKKLAVITSFTREMDEHSIPAIEGLLRQAIAEDTAVSLDSVLLDANAATTIRPAGILNGVASLTPTAGGGFNALTGDIKQISGAILTSTAGYIRNMAWILNPQQVLSASLTPAPGVGAFPFKDEISQGRLMTYPIIDSGTVPLGTVIAIDAADFVTVGGEAPRIEVSDQATLHYDDTNPAQIASGSPGVVASPTRSLWQTDSIALRMIYPLNWVIRRSGVVAWVAGVTW